MSDDARSAASVLRKGYGPFPAGTPASILREHPNGAVGVLVNGNAFTFWKDDLAPVALTLPHGVDCTCADDDPRQPLFEGMRCAMRSDWFEGDDPLDRPPPTPMNRYQHDPDGMAAWARARRHSIFPWMRRRAHHAILYAIHGREVALDWRRPSPTKWSLR